MYECVAEHRNKWDRYTRSFNLCFRRRKGPLFPGGDILPLQHESSMLVLICIESVANSRGFGSQASHKHDLAMLGVHLHA